MGYSMTNHMPVTHILALPVEGVRLDIAPPHAPLMMPKQVIETGDGLISRVILAPFEAMLNLFKHNFRRVG